jgi:putative selenate reductase
MGEILRPIPFPALIDWIQAEYRQRGSVFGIRKEKFYANKTGRGFNIFGRDIASPVGPAAGPHTQLAQNILSACLAGGRFIELKTVQSMDGKDMRKAIARPCINAVDEGYNVEWSTELTVEEALEEYVKAWFLCQVFTREFDLADSGGTVFTMSAGYSLEGIQSKKIDAFIGGMKDAENTQAWERCYRYLADHIGSFERFGKKDLEAISPAVSPGITLSTLHGCPREEIEKIAVHLIAEKGLHTFIKCNPTLLDYKTVRRILDDMGYAYIAFDDHHFRDDLRFNDAVDMMRRLGSLAKEKELFFGVKLTNTFPVDIKRGELPGGEMYLSGRPLFPLSIRAAKELAAAFRGELPISYSGGADFFNLGAILETGLFPVTAATTVLKPGGYERFRQLAELAENVMMKGERKTGVDLEALTKLAGEAPSMGRYRKEYRRAGLRKTGSVLPLFDCAKAPCMDGGCPIHQKIPRYLEETAAGSYKSAFDIIAVDNSAPSITGTICDHQCQNKCARVDYDDPLEIRRAKKIAAEYAQESYIESLRAPEPKTGASAAVIGAGPAGIAAAVFLRRNGVAVKVYEKRDGPYGIVRYVIPAFRITDEDINRDYRIARALGVDFLFGVNENYSVEALKKKHRFVVIATGAWKEGVPPVKTGEGVIREGLIIDALRFLENSKKSGCALDLGKRVAVIGGGDAAMDCARAAKRNRGVGEVRVVYRRTREFMPAQYEEQKLALEDGVIFDELLAPLSFQNGVLVCERTRLTDYDASGRRGITGTGETTEARFDALIGAVGARVDTTHFSRNGIELDARGCPRTSGANESSVPDVYIAGDCRAGAATVVKAIADGKTIAADILRKLGLPADFEAGGVFTEKTRGGGSAGAAAVREKKLYAKKGTLIPANNSNDDYNSDADYNSNTDDNSNAGGFDDGSRCLSCAELCEICVDVCPNRANTTILMAGAAVAGGAALPAAVPLPVPFTGRQVLHIDRLCNECGNCAVFCPHEGKPYRDKFTVFANEEDFADSGNPGFFRAGEGRFRLRLEDKSVINWNMGEGGAPKAYTGLIDLIMKNFSYLV